MSMTISQKILAKHCGLKSVKAGELIEAEVDLILGNDLTTPVAIREFSKIENAKVADPDKVVIVMDHFTPNKDIQSATQCKVCRDFAEKQGIKSLYDVGRVGIEHVLLPEKGYVHCNDLIVGADSHTCTYGALGAFSTGIGSTDMAAAMLTGKLWFQVPKGIQVVVKGKKNPWVSGKDVILWLLKKIGVNGADYASVEFTGAIEELTVDDRLTICNMAVEAGAKNAVFPVDEVAAEYLKKTGAQKGITFETAADILKGKKTAEGLRVIIIPATPKIYKEAIEAGYIQDLIEAGCAVMTPCCGPCIGGSMGILAQGERALATTNRNFTGRMGHLQSEIYLSSPAVAAASALTGYITHPQEVMK